MSTQPHSVFGHSGSLTHQNNVSLIKNGAQYSVVIACTS